MISHELMIALIIVALFERSFIQAIPLNVTSLECDSNEKYCTNNTCFLETKRNGIKLVNFICNFPIPVTHPMLEFKLMKSDGKIYKHEIFSTVEDICKLNDNTGRSNVIIRMLPRLKQNSEYPSECPMTNVVSLNHYPLDLSFFPSVAPSGKYLLSAKIFKSDTKELVVNATTKFEIKYNFNSKPK
ncbi:hypothetical protein ACFFRR_009242 [Megaselia abdita]